MTTVLTTRLDALDFATHLEAVRNSLNTAQAKVTFWGARIVEFQGNSETLTLDTLASRVWDAAHRRLDAGDLTLGERVAGMEIEAKLREFYDKTDEEIPHCNFFTRLLVWLREFSFIPYTPRFYLEMCSSPFQAFGVTEYQRLFGGPQHQATTEGAPRVRLTAERDQIIAAFRR